MPSPANQSQQNRGIDWLAIVRILLVQLVVLLALAFAFVGYVNWSSEVSLAEFIEASEPPVSQLGPRPQSSIPIRVVKGPTTCNRKD